MHIREYETKSGNKRYEVSEPHPHDSRRRVWSTGKSEREAKKKLLKKLQDIEQNTYVNKNTITISQYLDTWLENYGTQHLSQTTLDSYRFNIERHISPYFGDKRLQLLQPIDIEYYITDKLKKGRLDGNGGLSAKTVLYHIRILNEALGHALKPLKLIPYNPCADIKPPKPTKHKPNVCEVSDALKLFAAVKDMPMEIPIYLGAMLGLRRSEVLGLKWTNIDLDKAELKIDEVVVRVINTYTKTPKSEASIRKLPMAQILVDVLKRHKRRQAEQKLKLGPAYNDNDYVVKREDGIPITPSAFSHRYRRIIRNTNLPKIKFHELRHTFASMLIENGVPISDISEALGHSSKSVTLDTYAHIFKDSLKKVAQKMDDIYSNNPANLG